MEMLTVKIGEDSFISNQMSITHRPSDAPMMYIYLQEPSLDKIKDVFINVKEDTIITIMKGEKVEGIYTGYRFAGISFISTTTIDAGTAYQSEVNVSLEKVEA